MALAGEPQERSHKAECTTEACWPIKYLIVALKQVNASMVGIVKSLDVALAGNNLEKMAETMDKFETQFETLDVQTVRIRHATLFTLGSVLQALVSTQVVDAAGDA